MTQLPDKDGQFPDSLKQIAVSSASARLIADQKGSSPRFKGDFYSVFGFCHRISFSQLSRPANRTGRDKVRQNTVEVATLGESDGISNAEVNFSCMRGGAAYLPALALGTGKRVGLIDFFLKK